MDDGYRKEAISLLARDGSVGMTYNKKDSKWMTPVITLMSTRQDLVEFLKSVFGGCICKKKLTSFEWKVASDNAIECAKIILLHVVDEKKKHRLSMFVHQYKSVTPRNGFYTPEMKTAKSKFEEEFFKEVG